MATLKDIAADTGYSVSVVSRALNPRPDQHARMAPDTRRRIIAAAERLGFRRNRAAEALRRGRSLALGVFLPRTSNRLVADLVMGISERAEQEMLPVLYSFGQSARSYESFLDMSIHHAHAGIISYPSAALDRRAGSKMERFRAAGGRTVVLNAPSPASDAVNIAFDEAGGSAQAAEHLLTRGCRTIVCDDWYPLRRRPFLEVLAQHGREARLCGVEDPEALVAACRERGPTGYFAHSDLRAMQAIRILRAAGLRAGSDVLVVGYDDVESAASCDPPLTTLRQDFDEMGRRAIDAMLRLLAGETVDDATIRPRLIVRESA